MKINALHLLSMAAALALVAGIGWAVFSIRQAPVLAQSLKGRVAVLAELQALRRAQDRYATAVRTFAALSNAAPVSMASLAAAAVTNSIPDVRDLETRALERGWTLTRSEVIFNDINLDQLPAFFCAAESRRPPWRLAECAITVSSRADGCGRVVLVLEAIGKTGQ